MNKEDNTLVILSPGFPESEADSTCLPLQQNLVRAIQKTDPRLKIIVLALQYPYAKKSYTWHDVTVISFDGRNRGGINKFLLRSNLYKQLKQINASDKISGLLSFWYGECAWVGKKFASRNNIPHYCWLLGQDAKKDNLYPGKLSLPAKELVALSDFILDEFEKNHGLRPQHIIAPGIDTGSFPVFPIPKDIDILAAGSLIPLKQYDLFIDVIAEIKKEIQGIRVALIGDGPEKERLEVLAREKGLQSTITLTGELPYKEVLRHMQRAKVFLHTSSYEAFGMVCAEALYAGAKVISFVRPMKQDIKNWHHVRDKNEMIQKTIGLLHDPGTTYEPVLFAGIEETAKKIMGLFLT